MRQLLLFFCTILFIGPVLAQNSGIAADPQKRIVYFKDKANSPFSVQQPLRYLSQQAVERRNRQNIPITPRDFPVNPSYVMGLKQLQGVTVWYTSRWFNAVVVQCTDEKMAEIEALPYVKASSPLNRIAFTQKIENNFLAEDKLMLQSVQDNPFTQAAYGPAFTQADMLGAVELHNKGFSGQNMTIAVLDAGFPAVNTIPAFAHLFQNNRIKGTFDFVKKQVNVYGENAHGTAVLSTMAAFLPEQMIGTAPHANYLLLRTEDAATEHKIEEINWLLAAEYADSAGADVLNSSLGYTTFDPPSPSYTYNDLNGHKALVTRAADYAAATGMLVVVSAGNYGARTWRYLSAPADADSVLTVGAVNRTGVRASFSSEGPTADGRLKPDVMAVGEAASLLSTAGNVVTGSGTSFSGPIMAGFAACLWQESRSSTNQEIIRKLRMSGTQAANPDNLMGYGIPSYRRIVTSDPEQVENELFITNPVTAQNIVLTLGEKWVKQETLLQVYDVTGRLVYNAILPVQQYTHQLQLQPQTLKQGVYLCRLSSGNNRGTLRFLKL